MADYAIHEETLTDIADVIRKKDGSSALIDPADYPKRINLMGMLEEKTVSSSPIVTFADGADEVPLKKCEITLPASLDGYSEVDVVSAGKNLLNDSIRGNNGANIYFGHDTGTQIDFSLRLIAGTYTFSVVTADGTTTNLYVKNSDTNTLITGFPAYNVLSKTFTLAEDTNCAVYVYKSGYTSPADIISAQIEVGSSATTYEPYTAPTTYTASLGRTIHGGKVNLTDGTGSDENTKFTVTSDMSDSIRYIGSGDTSYIQINKTPASNGRWQDLVCSHFTPANIYAGGTQQGIGCYSSQFYIRDSQFASKQDFLDFLDAQETLGTPLEICYKLATSADFTFDPVPIDSKLGNNTIWSGQGDTEVTYRSQGTTTPILPTLVTKTITENGTYSAEDDDADGYSEVTVNVESIAKIGINSGKLNIVNGTITADDTYCYTDPFDCPSGVITMDVGEGIVSDYAGIELIYESDGSHANYWQGASRFREVDLTNYYAATKKARLAFKKQYLSKVLLMDFGNGKIYSSLNASQFEEPQANLLSMNNEQSEESEGSEE